MSFIGGLTDDSADIGVEACWHEKSEEYECGDAGITSKGYCWNITGGLDDFVLNVGEDDLEFGWAGFRRDENSVPDFANMPKQPFPVLIDILARFYVCGINLLLDL